MEGKERTVEKMKVFSNRRESSFEVESSPTLTDNSITDSTMETGLYVHCLHFMSAYMSRPTVNGATDFYMDSTLWRQ